MPRHNGARVEGPWGYPIALIWRGSVVPLILPNVLFAIFISTCVAYVYLVTQWDIVIAGSIIPSLSIVIGLILAFRTNTAYDRFWEGRKIWTSMNTSIRNFARVIWVGIKEKESGINDQKVRAINMLLAFAVATKHHLRAEYGTAYRDLQALLPEDFIPCQSSSNLRSQYIAHRNHLRTDKNDWVIARDNSMAAMSLPLEISFQLSLWINYVKDKELIDIPYQSQCTVALSNMVDCLGNLERILLTPIPVAYNIHLKQILTLYCCILPFTTVRDVGWLTIPLSGAVAFTLFGIEAIGNQIEDPFGFDANDLKLDDFCYDLMLELDYIVQTVPQDQSAVFESSSFSMPATSPITAANLNRRATVLIQV
ncbi:hypothetical protein DFQ27_003908 [Actinomortierella ambigua]|uniref:Uncharacterized protein n=1 Tax=Actinomortierella ambigua TaxID=1343610 RepID=A0A9P6U4S5_9FUNG|nr:hypothetical protein DFQ26_000048 [Actinomortierella ambigua]KAG0259730.1 hypothetical protein DFQ27_003908 [Actinomortierella ambigua]